MRMLRTNQSKITRPLSIRVHTALLASMCHLMPFSSSALKKKKLIFSDVYVGVKNKLKCGLSWSVLLSTSNACHYSFPKHFFVLLLHVEPVSKSF